MMNNRLKRLSKYLKSNISIFILVCLLIIDGVIYFVSANGSRANDISSNLFSEIIGIVITVIVIDSIIRNREKKERLNILNNAYIQIKKPIDHLMRLLNSMYKASCDTPPTEFPVNYKDAFSSPHFLESIQLLDFKSDAPIYPTSSWISYASSSMKEIKESIDTVLDKYAFILDSKSISYIESIKDTTLINFLIQISNIRQFVKDSPYFCPFAGDGTKIVNDVLSIIFDLFNHLDYQLGTTTEFKFDKAVWKENMAPKVGASRVKSE